jgi:hypothetical protein
MHADPKVMQGCGGRSDASGADAIRQPWCRFSNPSSGGTRILPGHGNLTLQL